MASQKPSSRPREYGCGAWYGGRPGMQLRGISPKKDNPSDVLTAPPVLGWPSLAPVSMMPLSRLSSRKFLRMSSDGAPGRSDAMLTFTRYYSPILQKGKE